MNQVSNKVPKYHIQANYVGEGVKGLLREGGSSRRTTVANLFESMGGRLETFYYAFGETDAYIIADLPDNVTATALLLTVSPPVLLPVRPRC